MRHRPFGHAPNLSQILFEVLFQRLVVARVHGALLLVTCYRLGRHSPAIRKVLEFYMIKREDIPLADEDSKNRKIAAFENSCPTTISEECRRLLRAVGVTLNDN